MAASASRFDFLTAPIAEGHGLRRSGDDFIVDRPWATAYFGKIALRRGWWRLECESSQPVGAAMVHAGSAGDPLVVFPASGGDRVRIFLVDEAGYDLNLLVSPWPGAFPFARLALCRLTQTEEMQLVAVGVQRLLTNRRPLQVFSNVARRLLAGQAIGLRTAPATLADAASPSERAVRPPGAAEAIVHDGFQAALESGDVLHPRAAEIIQAEFERSPDLKAVYCDVNENGVIRPHLAWNPELARRGEIAGLPVFVRSGVNAAGTTGWAKLADTARRSGAGAVRGIALPLVERPAAIAHACPVPPQPQLERTPHVTAVIPTKIRADLLEKCLDGLASQTGYPALDVVIVDNGIENPRFKDVLARASTSLDLRVVEDKGGFNFSRLVNTGVAHAKGEIVLLLNDDVQAIEPGWLHRLVDSTVEEDVGAVGARLLYPNRTIQHAGVTLGLGGVCGHLWKGTPPAEAAMNPYIVYPGQRLAVTGACLAVRRELYQKIGGLDEAAFPVAFNDVDFCLRLHIAGYRNVYRGDATLVHHESQSRGSDDASLKARRRLAAEVAQFMARWKRFIDSDPFGSPAIDPASEQVYIHPALRNGEWRLP